MVKIFNFFIIWPRHLKFWLYEDYEALITYQLENFGLGPWFAQPPSPRAPKVQNFRIFVFQRRAFKIGLYIDFGALISYQLKILVWIAHIYPPSPLKGWKLKIWEFENFF